MGTTLSCGHENNTLILAQCLNQARIAPVALFLSSDIQPFLYLLQSKPCLIFVLADLPKALNVGLDSDSPF